MNEVSALVERDMIELAFSFCSLSCEDIAGKWPSADQEGGLHQEANHAGTLISDFQPPKL